MPSVKMLNRFISTIWQGHIHSMAWGLQMPFSQKAAIQRQCNPPDFLLRNKAHSEEWIMWFIIHLLMHNISLLGLEVLHNNFYFNWFGMTLLSKATYNWGTMQANSWSRKKTSKFHEKYVLYHRMPDREEKKMYLIKFKCARWCIRVGSSAAF